MGECTHYVIENEKGVVRVSDPGFCLSPICPYSDESELIQQT